MSIEQMTCPHTEDCLICTAEKQTEELIKASIDKSMEKLAERTLDLLTALSIAISLLETVGSPLDASLQSIIPHLKIVRDNQALTQPPRSH